MARKTDTAVEVAADAAEAAALVIDQAVEQIAPPDESAAETTIHAAIEQAAKDAAREGSAVVHAFLVDLTNAIGALRVKLHAPQPEELKAEVAQLLESLKSAL